MTDDNVSTVCSEVSLILSEESASGSIEQLYTSRWYTVLATSPSRQAERGQTHLSTSSNSDYGRDLAGTRSTEKQRRAEGPLDIKDGLLFSIPLDHTIVPGSPLPGCIHLLEAGLGQVVWHIRVRVQGLNLLATPKTSPGASSPSLDKVEVEEKVEVHLTPCQVETRQASTATDFPRAGSSSSSGLATTTTTTITGRDLAIPAGKACKMVVSAVETSNTESIAVGVEISSDPQRLDEDEVKWLRGIRRVRIQWWRRVRVDVDDQRGDSSDPPASRRSKESLTLLHKSGKLCRYSSDRQRPIRLLFELPPLRNVLSNTHSAAALGGVGCGDVSQQTPCHQVDFFVRVIVESRGGGTATPSIQASSSSNNTGPQNLSATEGDPIVLEQVIRVLPPTWDQLLPYVMTIDETGVSDRLAIAQALHEDEINGEATSLMSEDARNRAYRLKGSDVVGDTGTYRQDHTGEGAASSSGNPPPFDANVSSHEGNGDPPSFFDTTTGSGGDVLPSFDESERHNQSRFLGHGIPGAISGQGAGSSRTTRPPAPAQLTGELATWREYDGYETFSAPPPAAWESLGLSGSMDPPSTDNADLDAVHGDAALRGADERVRLMEHLGLGEGTRVIDTQEDMPPGFDEPSLPSLPNAIMPHHRRAIQRRTALEAGEPHQDPSDPRLDESPPPPAFSRESNPGAEAQQQTRGEGGGTRQVLPPPSFAASEAAEARGIAATGPEPVMTTARAAPVSSSSPPSLRYQLPDEVTSAPPVYSDESHPTHQEAPPGYSRAH